MSLKSFHIFFIVVATLTTLAFGIWSLTQDVGVGKAGSIALGVGSLAASALLVIYGVRFFKKLKQLGPIPRS